MKLTVNSAVRDLLAKNRIMTRNGEPWPLGVDLRIHPDASIEPYSHFMVGTIIPKAQGAFSYSFSVADGWLEMGRYCSIAQKVVLMGSSHPHDWVSSHPFSHNPGPLHGVKAYLADIGAGPLPLTSFERHDPGVWIGHDVWIGDEAMIKRDVTIGHGAIIAARSVVTKDVPPYAIVGGVPAKVIRYRFDETTIERLLASQWWRYGPDVLQAIGVKDVGRFLERLAEQEALGDISPLELTPLTASQLIEASKVT